jgi:hypothetical protein
LVEMRIPSPEAQYQLGLDHGVSQLKGRRYLRSSG